MQRFVKESKALKTTVFLYSALFLILFPCDFNINEHVCFVTLNSLLSPLVKLLLPGDRRNETICVGSPLLNGFKVNSLLIKQPKPTRAKPWKRECYLFRWFCFDSIVSAISFWSFLSFFGLFARSWNFTRRFQRLNQKDQSRNKSC